MPRIILRALKHDPALLEAPCPMLCIWPPVGVAAADQRRLRVYRGQGRLHQLLHTGRRPLRQARAADAGL